MRCRTFPHWSGVSPSVGELRRRSSCILLAWSRRKTMGDNIISYQDMCSQERASLQQGMNYALGGSHSVILMSVRPNAPYRDTLADAGTTLIYEGHDQPRKRESPNPKTLDQLEEY